MLPCRTSMLPTPSHPGQDLHVLNRFECEPLTYWVVIAFWDVTYWRIVVSQAQEVVVTLEGLLDKCSQVCNCVVGAWLPKIPSLWVWLGEVLWRSMRKKDIQVWAWDLIMMSSWLGLSVKWDNHDMEHLISKSVPSVNCQWQDSQS